jgi:hypothetical protein
VYHGLANRVARPLPPVDKKELRRFRSFVRLWIRRNLIPLQEHEILTFEEWLSTTSYNEGRKNELRRAYDELIGFPRGKRTLIKGHVKAESYAKAFPPARGIHSRHDAFKVFCGPIFKSIEQRVFQHPAFVKHIPVPDRPGYLKERLYSASHRYITTDYTAFEGSFTPQFMRSCEDQLYKYMVPSRRQEMNHICSVMGGTNHIDYLNVGLKMKGSRMSGEMCTSLGNGFSNLMIMEYIMCRAGAPCSGVVEGDDGLFVYPCLPLDLGIASRLGFTLKFEVVEQFSQASFCGIVADPDVLQNVVDPREVLVKFGWTHSPRMHGGHSVRMGLLRAKALSLLHETPACPIVTCLAKKFVQLTCGHDPIYDHDWYSCHLRRYGYSGDSSDVHYKSRVLVEKLYDIPVGLQLEVEAAIDAMDCVDVLPNICQQCVISHPAAGSMMSYFARYQQRGR